MKCAPSPFPPQGAVPLLLCAALLLCAGGLRAQGRGKVPAGVNLSLWKGVATQRSDTIGRTFFNAGFFTSANRLDGAGLNLLGSSFRRQANGLQLSGIFNMAGGGMSGVQAAGIANVAGGKLSGLSAAGLAGIAGDGSCGALLCGLAGITGDNTRGAAISGLLNVTGNASAGLFAAGLGNINGGSLAGAAFGGLLDIVGEDLRGVQVSGLLNITGNEMRGVQVAPANVAVSGKGLQIGLFNYYRESFEGFQLGLVNANPRTRVQLMVFGGNRAKLNAGARFKNDLFYTILGGGCPYLGFGDRFSASFFYRAGLELPLSRRLFLSGDLGFQHIETFSNRHRGYPVRLYALQGRINLECRLSPALGVFVTGGYGNTRRYSPGGRYEDGAILEGGLALFRY